MTVFDRIYNAALLPQIKTGSADDAVLAAKALLSGGVDAMELICRSDDEAAAIAAVQEQCPDMLVGAQCATWEACEKAAESGAQFLTTPGYSEKIVAWCDERGIPVIPGCVTPSEIMAATVQGVRIVKFFPAEAFGGMKTLASLAEVFEGVKFLPCGGIDNENLADYVEAPFVQAVGGSWLCTAGDIAARSFEVVTERCKAARAIVLGFTLGHVGVNAANAEESLALCKTFRAAFGFNIWEMPASFFASSGVEVMKHSEVGTNGHIAILTNSVRRAEAELAKKGFALDLSTEKCIGGEPIAVYFQNELGGFAVHLLKKGA